MSYEPGSRSPVREPLPCDRRSAAPRTASADRRLGIFVNPMFLHDAGSNDVLDQFLVAGATALCTTPKLARPATDGGGVRFPDLHGDGHRRVLTRPLWGAREHILDYRFALSPVDSWYRATPYRPTGERLANPGDVRTLRQTLAAATERKLRVYLLVQPFKVPRLAAADAPRLPDGRAPRPAGVAALGDPAAPAVRAYGTALALHIAHEYPGISGLIFDWAEYAAYRFDELFLGLGDAAEELARGFGFDAKEITRDVGDLWREFHSLQPADLDRAGDFMTFWTTRPGTAAFLKLKSRIITSFVGEVRAALDTQGFEQLELAVRGWPPPFNAFSGSDYAALSGLCDFVAPKLFLFDYAALPRWYAETLLEWNPGLPPTAVLDALTRWFDLPDSLQPRRLEKYQIPAPDTPHPVPLDSYAARLDKLRETVRGGARFEPFAHAYLPDAQWDELLGLLSPISTGLWIQMYEYLSDHKLASLPRAWPTRR